MALPTRPLREGHCELYPEILRLRGVAESVWRTQLTTLRANDEQSYRFLIGVGCWRSRRASPPRCAAAPN